MAAIKAIESDIKSSALELIGNTPLVAFDRVYPGPGRLLVKCEFMNPCASVKCRSSLNMIQTAIAKGELPPGKHIVELTSGNQGCGLAVVCAVLGYPLTLVMSAGNSIQRRVHMEALGAKCVTVPQVEGTYGRVTGKDVDAVEQVTAKLVEDSNVYFINQICNEANTGAHYSTTGPEIWKQTGHRVDAFVCAVGTAGTFTGVSKFLKEKNPELQAHVVEPAGAEAIKGDPIEKPIHLLQGAGYGRIPTLFNYDYLDGTIPITDEEALEYKKLIGEKEGLYIGYTSAANVAAAVKLLKSGKLPKDAWVVTLLPDTGLKYISLSTEQ